MGREALVIGLGISGCVAARVLAESGYSVTCFEKESHIGGYLFEDVLPSGLRRQLYGPHIFHTDNEKVYTFLKRFGAFYPYVHRVLARINDTPVPLPLNASSLNTLFGEARSATLIHKLNTHFGPDKRISVTNLLRSGDSSLIELGKFIINHILVPEINHLPDDEFTAADDSYMNDGYVHTGYSDNYYEDRYQAMPMDGFCSLLDNMLDHKNITYFLNMDAFSRISLHEESDSILLDGAPFKGIVVCTPSLDTLFGFRYGALRFRTSTITNVTLSQDFYLQSAVQTCVSDSEVVRITEDKQITLQDIPNETTICKESHYFSTTNSLLEPFEPECTEENLELYEKYQALASKYSSLIPLGRNACMRNLSIAQCVDQAMNLLSYRK